MMNLFPLKKKIHFQPLSHVGISRCKSLLKGGHFQKKDWMVNYI
jgi:hypothetical protein